MQKGSEYQVLFKSGKKDFIIHVSLSNDFPRDKPKLKISPNICHTWVNADGEITSAPGILNFTNHLDLGQVVQVIISEFVRTPPPLLESINASPCNREADIGRISPNVFPQSFSPPAATNKSRNYQNSVFHELSTMPLDELVFLNECSERQEEFLDNLPQSKEVNKQADDLINLIEETADNNLTKRDQLEGLQKAIHERLESVTKLVLETEQLNIKYQNLSDRFSPKNIKNQIATAAKTADNQSEHLCQQFLDGSMDVDKFVLEFMQKRTLAQMRKTKEEKLSQQLMILERAGF
ncbi:PREDICTED: vacuolar protein sorting-associated protein 37A isoform X2 [Nicrophorus vespilloides]|uniref:Vacuolar protein sorting-associated protein 37A isoform X2 n=1 Tax=Nicrophorus vespilloides TaxID=110193 RepID=A0ABM1N8I6_NICVS|nr:PREDICTED: vacuolar protein sorting-associated protein 37A isoform X2 [Nicrophorus vespilloides]